MNKENDLVFGFSFRSEKEKAQQEYVCAPENLFGKVPSGWENRLAECVTLPNNFVTAWNTLLNVLGLALPWPKPSTFNPSTDPRILVWGGSSSVGQYALQILTYYGYRKVIATASPRNFDLVKDPFLASHLQPEIMPTLLTQGIVRPNKPKIVEGATLLERAQKALDILRRKEFGPHPAGRAEKIAEMG
ncbi:MAG: hypothetical protein Q9184_000289 [Pyrenodesmia sp. 2 TL-2023]